MTNTRAPEQPTGQWVVPPVSYVEPIRIACAFCGRPIARQYWQASPTGIPQPFCDPAHASLYVSYWLPLYGTSQSETSDR